MKLIHIWNFPYNVSILLKKSFLIYLRSELKNKYRYLRLIHKFISPNSNFSSFKNILKPSYVNFRDLKIFIKICNDLSVPLYELEKNILAYRTTGGHCLMKNPRLPIEVNPIFDMVIAHIFGDGNSVKIDGRELYFNYRQFDNELLNLFLKKAERLFGKIKYENNYFNQQKKIYLPTITSLILANYYSLKSEDFLSDRCVIPEKMFSHSKDHLLAVLIAFIIDEGFIDSSQVVISLRNKRLVSDIGRICDILEYKYTIREDKKISNKATIYILEDGTKRFWDDYLVLKKKYPEVNLGYKEDQIKDFILRKEKRWRSESQGITKNVIINLLKDKPRTIRDLAKILLISRQGIRFHLKKLVKGRIVRKDGKGKKGSDIYSLLKFVQVPVARKGRSRQYGATKEKIIELLMEFGKLDTKEISNKLKMRRGTIYTLLRYMQKQKIIKRIDKKVYKTHPSTVWCLIK